MVLTQRAALVNPGGQKYFVGVGTRACQDATRPPQTPLQTLLLPGASRIMPHCHQWPASHQCRGQGAPPGPVTKHPPLRGTEGRFLQGFRPATMSQSKVLLSTALDPSNTGHAVTGSWELSHSAVVAHAAQRGGQGHQHMLGEHPMAMVVGTTGRLAFGEGCNRSRATAVSSLCLGGTNYPHTSNISSHFHNQLTSALYHRASEKGVVTQLLREGRDSWAGMHNHGRPSFPTWISEQVQRKQNLYRTEIFHTALGRICCRFVKCLQFKFLVLFICF